MGISSSGGGPVTAGNSSLDHDDTVVFHATCTGGEDGTLVLDDDELPLTCAQRGEDPEEHISDPVSIEGSEIDMDATDFDSVSRIVVNVYPE